MKTARLIEEEPGIAIETRSVQNERKIARERPVATESAIHLPQPGETAIIGNAVVRAVPVINHEGATEGVFYVLGPKV